MNREVISHRCRAETVSLQHTGHMLPHVVISGLALAASLRPLQRYNGRIGSGHLEEPESSETREGSADSLSGSRGIASCGIVRLYWKISTMNKEAPSNNKFITPRSINDTLQYQEDAVVSRELIQKPGGTITLFAFDKHQGLSEHTAPYDAFVMLTEGRAEITVSGVKHELKAGEMLLMPANSPHALRAIEPFKMVLTMIKS